MIGPHEANTLYTLRMFDPYDAPYPYKESFYDAGLAWAGKAGLHGEQIHYICGRYHPESEDEPDPWVRGEWVPTSTVGGFSWKDWLKARGEYTNTQYKYVYLLGRVEADVPLKRTWKEIREARPDVFPDEDPFEFRMPTPQVHQGYAAIHKKGMPPYAKVLAMVGTNDRGLEVWTLTSGIIPLDDEPVPIELEPMAGWRQGKDFKYAHAQRALNHAKTALGGVLTRFIVDLERYTDVTP